MCVLNHALSYEQSVSNHTDLSFTILTYTKLLSFVCFFLSNDGWNKPAWVSFGCESDYTDRTVCF